MSGNQRIQHEQTHSHEDGGGDDTGFHTHPSRQHPQQQRGQYDRIQLGSNAKSQSQCGSHGKPASPCCSRSRETSVRTLMSSATLESRVCRECRQQQTHGQRQQTRRQCIKMPAVGDFFDDERTPAVGDGPTAMTPGLRQQPQHQSQRREIEHDKRCLHQHQASRDGTAFGCQTRAPGEDDLADRRINRRQFAEMDSSQNRCQLRRAVSQTNQCREVIRQGVVG